jgi:transcriptional regulator with XRE-family HTH domain
MVGKSRTVPAAKSRKLGKRAAPAKRRAKAVRPTEVELLLGRRISALRAGVGFTQDRLAAKAGFTKGYLSKIENSKVIPPIGTLVKIAQVLDTDLADLFEAAPASAANDAISIVRSWERETAIRGGSSFGYDYVALAHKRHHKQMEPFVMVFPSRVDKDIRFEHQGEEFMFILSGKVEFEATIDGRNKTWILQPGDSAYFDAEIPHRGRSLRGESRALVVIYRSKDSV